MPASGVMSWRPMPMYPAKDGKDSVRSAACMARVCNVTFRPSKFRDVPGVNASPLFDHALKQHRRGDLTQAVEMYRTLLNLYPDHAEVHRHLGLALLQRGEVDDAEPHLLRARELLPQSASVCGDLGTLYKLRNQTQEAERCYLQALVLDPNHSD